MPPKVLKNWNEIFYAWKHKKILKELIGEKIKIFNKTLKQY